MLLAGVILASDVIPHPSEKENVSDLSGTWKFHTGDDPQWANPDFNDSNWPGLFVPLKWSQQGYQGYCGVAWYRVHLPALKVQHSAVSIGQVSDAYQVFVNGVLIGGVGKLPPGQKIDYDRRSIYSIPEDVAILHTPSVMALRVWHSRETDASTGGGAISGRFLLGPAETLTRMDLVASIPVLILSVLFVSVGFYHLMIYRRRTQLTELLWFAFLGLSVAGYSFLRTQWKYSISDNFVLLKKLEYIFLYLMPVLFIQFLWPLFKRPIGKLLRGYQYAIILVLVVVTLAPGLYLNTASLDWWEFALVPIIFSSLFLVAQSAWLGHPEARTIAMGIFFVLLTGLNDILVDRSIIHTPRLITYGFAAFVFTMVISLANRYLRLYVELDALRQNLESRVAERTKDLATANERLNQLDEVKTQFFANISHEFRTPLTLTIGPLENALQGLYGAVSGPLEAQMQIMLRNSRKLLKLINQLLDISKLEAGKMALTARRRNLVAFTREVLLSFSSFAERKNISLQFDTEEEAIETPFDADKVEKILDNLISNAFKFTPENGKIRVTLTRAATDVVIRIKDTGRGIPKEDLPHIFDRFYQVAATKRENALGTGIGLSLVKDLVTLHGGKIEAKSEEGFGSEFVVTLPLGLAESAGAPEETGHPLRIALKTDTSSFKVADLAAARADMDSTARNTILLVDDNDDMRNFISGCLEHTYRIEQASNGKQGLEKASQLLPDLIISDVMMPVMDGYEFCRRIKSAGDNIPVILLTAKASEDMKLEGLEAGADDYMSKPFNAKELQARVRNMIQLRRQERELRAFNAELEKKVKEQFDALLRSKRVGKFLPAELVQSILASEEDVDIRSERKDVTIFFSDLTGFTDLNDRIEPELITKILNEYFAEMSALVHQHEGMIGRFMGDGIMVLFGASHTMDIRKQAENSVRMAVAMQHRIRQLAEKWSRDGIDHRIQARMGIAQDYVTVGSFGSKDFMEFTAIGSGVNLASRLETACPHGGILVNFTVYSLTKDLFPYGSLEEKELKGFARTLRVAQLNPEQCALPSV